jgi:hypothetical protein
MKLRLVIASISLVVVPLLVLVMIRTSTESGLYNSLWAVPFIGSVVLPVLAIALHAIAGFMLAKLPPNSEGEVERLSNELPVLRKKRDEQNAGVASLQLFKQAGQEKGVDLDNLFEEAQVEVDQLSELRKATEATLAKTPTGSAVTAAESALQAARERDYKNSEDRVAATSPLLENLASLAEAHQATEGWAEYIALLDVVREAATHAADIAEQQAAAKKVLDEAIAKWNNAGRALELQDIAIEKAESSLEEARKAGKQGWRDAVFAPLCLLVAAGLLYPVWYGWVLTTVSLSL